MEWKSDEEGVQHANAFAEEFAALLKKYGAEIGIETTYFGYDMSTSEIVINFNCCSASIEFGYCTDFSDMRIQE